MCLCSFPVHHNINVSYFWCKLSRSYSLSSRMLDLNSSEMYLLCFTVPELLHCTRWKRVSHQVLLPTAPWGPALSRTELLSPPPHGPLLHWSPIMSPSPQSLQPPKISKSYLPLPSAPLTPAPDSQILLQMDPHSHRGVLYLKSISQKILQTQTQ